MLLGQWNTRIEYTQVSFAAIHKRAVPQHPPALISVLIRVSEILDLTTRYTPYLNLTTGLLDAGLKPNQRPSFCVLYQVPPNTHHGGHNKTSIRSLALHTFHCRWSSRCHCIRYSHMRSRLSARQEPHLVLHTVCHRCFGTSSPISLPLTLTSLVRNDRIRCTSSSTQ